MNNALRGAAYLIIMSMQGIGIGLAVLLAISAAYGYSKGASAAETIIILMAATMVFVILWATGLLGKKAFGG